MDYRIKLKISPALQAKIDVCMAHCPTTEWYGILFYKSTGLQNFKLSDQQNPENHGTYPEFEAVDMFPIAGGTETYTSGEPSVDIATYAMEHSLLRCHKGMIHSHNKMRAYFSGIDENTLESEIRDTDYPFYLSLVVSSTSEYAAKLIWKWDEAQVITSEFTALLPFNKKVVVGKRQQTSNKRVLSKFDLNVIRPDESEIDRSNAFSYLMEVGEKIMPTALRAAIPQNNRNPLVLDDVPAKSAEEAQKEEEEHQQEILNDATTLLYRMIIGYIVVSPNDKLSDWTLMIKQTAKFYEDEDNQESLECYWNVLLTHTFSWAAVEKSLDIFDEVVKTVKDKTLQEYFDSVKQYIADTIDESGLE